MTKDDLQKVRDFVAEQNLLDNAVHGMNEEQYIALRILDAALAAPAVEVTAPPSREWQELSPLEMRDTLRNCAASTFDKLAPNWYEVRQFARAIEAALRAKNTGEQA